MMIARPSRTLSPLGWLAICLISPALAAQDAPAEHPLIPAIKLAQQSLDVMQGIRDYEATLIKREIVNGQDIRQRMQMRLRHEPLSIYMKFEEPNAGREILFVHGQNQNQLLAHEGGGIASLVGTLSLPLNDPKVTAENRYPITNVGMKRLLELVIAQWEIESKYGEIEVNFFPDAKMGNIACEAIQVTHPQPRNQFRFHKSELFLEKQSRLPIRLVNYGFPRQPGQPAPLLEEYTYLGIRPNVGLTDLDFDRRNPRYAF